MKGEDLIVSKKKSAKPITVGNAKKLQAHLKKDKLAAPSIVYYNNPPAFVMALRNMNLTSMVSPDTSQVEAVLKRLIYRKDWADIGKIMNATPYLPTAGNLSTNPEFWKGIDLTPGDFNGLYKDYVLATN